MNNKAKIIDGKALANAIQDEIAKEIISLREKTRITPGLAVIIVGDNKASSLYVKNKIIACKKVGMHSFEYSLPKDISEKTLINKIDSLNKDHKVHGILVQLPLPKHINSFNVINAINQSKDVDGFTAINIGKSTIGEDCFVPCTPQGVLILIKQVLTDLSSTKSLVIGRSNIVGKPMLQILLQENSTVTIAHSYTKNLAKLCKEADIIVAAIGKEKFIQGSWIKTGAIVIDVGINYEQSGKIIGDVDFAEAINYAGYITTVPGGVGPMTVACLLKNTLKAATKQIPNFAMHHQQ